MTAGAAGNAVTIEGGADNEIRRSELFGRSFGVKVTDSDGLVIADTRAEGSFGSAIEVAGDQARIVRNETPHSGGAMSITSGIQLAGSGGRIADNTVDGAWDVGGIARLRPEQRRARQRRPQRGVPLLPARLRRDRGRHLRRTPAPRARCCAATAATRTRVTASR